MEIINKQYSMLEISDLSRVKDLFIESQEDWADCPEFLSFNWEDVTILRTYSYAFLSILAYNSIVSNPSVTEKLKNSKLLSKVAIWTMDFKQVVLELNSLALKYPEMNVWQFADDIVFYLSFRTQKAFLSIISEDKSALNFSSEFEYYFTQNRKSPNVTIKQRKRVKDLQFAFVSGVQNKDTNNQLDKLFKKDKDPINSMVKMLGHTLIDLASDAWGRKEAMKLLIGAMNGDSYATMRLLPTQGLEEKYKDRFYRDLFPLFKLILKDKNLLSEEEHKIDLPNTYYNTYKVVKVKTILGKTHGKN
jgi:hypothetical protein